MVTRLLVQLGLLVCVSALLAGCPSREGSEAVDDPAAFIPDPTPTGPPVFKDIVEVFYGYLRDTNDTEDSNGTPFPANQNYIERADSLSLLSYDPELVIEPSVDSSDRNPQSIFNADSGIMVALDFEVGARFEAEMTVFSHADTVYKADHVTGEIKALTHFFNQICEIIPVQRVDESGDVAGDQTYTVLNENWVYIKTTEGNPAGDGCVNGDTAKRYYRLSLNYQLDPSDLELCFGEGEGQNTDLINCKTKQLPVVLEPEARAQLVFGWVDDDVTPTVDDHKLDYGYLGYGFVEQELHFFDKNRQTLWVQEREIQAFEVVDLLQSEYSPHYIATLTPLAQQNYMLQLGRDIFVVDSSRDLFGKDFSQTDTILTDRALQMGVQFAPASVNEMITQAEIVHDDEDLIVVNDDKIYRYDFAATAFVPNHPDRNFTIANQLAISYAPVNYREAKPFSQFDLSSCADESSALAIAECKNAHDLEDAILPSPGPAWQFFTECDIALGCEVVLDSTDYCTTEAELLANPTLTNICTPSEYSHLNELDDVTNDADFRGFMQYSANYIRDLDYAVNQGALFVTARMKEKDILLRYVYDLPLSDPKTDREHILFGERVDHYGLQAVFSQNNLFVTTLNPGSLRSNECYKNYQKVVCDLGILDDGGGQDVCTGLDISDGTCTNEFREYNSSALFCTLAQIDSGSCNDASLIPNNLLRIESPAQDAKWQSVQDLTLAGDDKRSMFLLLSDDVLDDPVDGTDSYLKDEGVLGLPTIYAIDELTGAIGDALGVLEAEVEMTLEGRIANADLGRVDAIAADVIQIGGASESSSSAAQLFLVDPFNLGVGSRVDKVAEFQVLRPTTK